MTAHDIGLLFLALALLLQTINLYFHSAHVEQLAADVQALGRDVDSLFPPTDPESQS